eukprot:4896833-Pyramimonas_sp.AAC.1
MSPEGPRRLRGPQGASKTAQDIHGPIAPICPRRPPSGSRGFQDGPKGLEEAHPAYIHTHTHIFTRILLLFLLFIFFLL